MRMPSQCAVVLASTRRAGSAVHGDMNLVTRLKLPDKMTRQETGQPWRHPSPDNQRHTLEAGCVVEFEQRLHISDPVGNRHDGHAHCDQTSC